MRVLCRYGGPKLIIGSSPTKALSPRYHQIEGLASELLYSQCQMLGEDLIGAVPCTTYGFENVAR